MIPPHMEDLPNESVIPPTFVEDTHTSLDDIGTFLQAAEVAVMSDAIDKLTAIESECSTIEAKLLGRIGVGLTEVEAACNKVRAKLNTSMARTAESMYEHLGAAGLPFPSMEEVRTDLGIAESNGFAVQPLQPQLTGTTTGTLPPTSTDGTTPTVVTSGDIVFEPPGPGYNPIPNCPPGYYPVQVAGGQWVCRPVNPPTLPTTPPQPPGGIFGQITPPEQIDPAPYWNPDSCTYEMPTPQVLAEGDCTARPDGPRIGMYIEAWCTGGCHVHWQIVSAFAPPDKTHEGSVIYGPYYNIADLGQGYDFCHVFWKAFCESGTVGEGDGEETTDEDDDTGDDAEEEEDEEEEPEDEDEDEDEDEIEPEPAPPAPPPQIEHGDDICKAIQKSIANMGVAVQPPGEDNKVEITVGAAAGLGDAIKGEIKGDGGSAIEGFLKALQEWAEKTLHEAVNGLDCNRAQLLFVSLFEAGFRFVDKWTGMVPRQMLEQLEILSRTVCQSRLPDGGMADVAYLRGDIDRETWECYHKAKGDHIGPAEKIMMAGRAKLDPMQLDKLNRRKLVPDAELDKLMREAGVLKREDQQRIHDWNQQFPSHSEVITMMNRDVADEQNVDWTEPDKLFRNNYQGKIKDWFDANGMDEQLAKYFWRAHFHIPSYSMGQAFLFRKRAGKDGIEKPFTREDFRKMLVQDDWHPGFIDHMIDTAYRVPTRRDILMSFMLHTIKDDQFTSYLQDWGYTAEGADFFLNLYKVKRQIADAKAAGYPTLRQLANNFADCLLSEQEFRDASAILVVDQEQQDEAVKAASLSRQLRQRKQAVAAIRRPFMLGIIDDADTRQRLSEAGIDGKCQDEYIQNWTLLAAKQDKQESAAQLCGMLESGIIQPAKFVDALIRQRWDAESAIRMLQQCEFKINEKEQRKAEALARRIQAEQRRAAKEAERLRRLQECGPPACPKNTPGYIPPSEAGQKNPGPGSNGTVPTTQPS